MTFDSINPATGEHITTYATMQPSQVQAILGQCQLAQRTWGKTAVEDRAQRMMAAHDVLMDNREEYARLMSAEMGKIYAQGLAEVEKCAWGCRYYAGRAVAAEAGRALKKCVLELGGSDPFILLEDADIDKAVEAGIFSRFQASGQSCIAAKRFIVVDAVYDEFEQKFVAAVRRLKMGDPLAVGVFICPQARTDLRGGSDSLCPGGFPCSVMKNLQQKSAEMSCKNSSMPAIHMR